MCGRYASFREAQDLADEFALASIADDARLLPPSWNVAPTDPVRMIVERPERLPDGSQGAIERTLRNARWGLVPSWAKSPAIGNTMINARSETLLTKPAFKRAFATRRALLPADGYYEWQPSAPDAAVTTKQPIYIHAADDAPLALAGLYEWQPPEPGAAVKTKQPIYIHAADDAPLALAGLYEFWKDPTKADDDPARWLVSVAIVTTTAIDEMGRVHDRQPVMLLPDRWDAWLDPAIDGEGAAVLLSSPAPNLELTSVSTAVNKVGNNGPSLIVPA